MAGRAREGAEERAGRLDGMSRMRTSASGLPSAGSRRESARMKVRGNMIILLCGRALEGPLQAGEMEIQRCGE